MPLVIKYLLVGLMLFSIYVHANESYSIVKPSRVREFIAGSDAVILFCKTGDARCSIGLAVLRGMMKEGLDDADIEGSIKIGFMDSTDYVIVAQTYGAATGREFVYFQHGKVHNTIPVEYINHIDTLKQWIEKSSKDLLTEYTSMDEFNEEVKECAGEYSTVVYFSDNQNPELDHHLLQLHLKFDTIFQVKAMRSPALIAQAGEKLGTIKVFQCYDNQLSKEFTRPIDDDYTGLTDWILHRGTPLVTRATEETVRKASRLFGLCVIVAVPEGMEDSIVAMLTKVAKQESVGFVWDYQERLDEWTQDAGGSGLVFPTAFAITETSNPPISWNERETMTEASLLAWVRKLIAGTAEPFRKSAPIPKPSKDAVQELVYDQFVDTVSSGDVVVLFYGRYNRCPECYSAQYAFKQLAEANVFKKKVKFYQYDITKNHLAQPLSRMPDIFLYKTNGDIIRFPDDPYTKKSFEKWLQKYFPIPHDEL